MTPLARGVAAGLLGGALISIPATEALETLAQARAERDTVLIAAVAPASPVVAPALSIEAGSAERASMLLAARVQKAASGGGLLIEAVAPVPDASVARVRLRVSGSEAAVLALAGSLERGVPLVRFAQWQVTSTGTAVRLTGELVASWR
jgi:alanine dehydrogenase